MTTRRAFAKALALAPLMAPALSRAFAQDRDYPNRTVQLVVGFPAGQASDIGARLLAKAMADDLKQAVFVDNKPGATGIIAHQFVKNAAPDGYTLLFGSTATLAINPSLFRKLPYDPLKDFAPVGDALGQPDVPGRRHPTCRSTRLPRLIALREGQSRQDDLRLGRQRLDPAHRDGAAEEGAGPRHDARALQGHAAAC